MLYPMPPEIEPLVIGSPPLVSYDLLKKYARIDSSDEDDLLPIYLKAAIEWAEGFTHRIIFQRGVKWPLRHFPISEIRLPLGKTVSVEAVEYVVNGQSQYLYGPSSGNSPVSGDYLERLGGDSGAIIMPPQGGCWPSPDCDVPAPVTVHFTAGWDAAEVPADIITAILFAVADAFDMRTTGDFDANAVAAGGSRFAIRQMMLSPYCMTRFY
jgi:uncharacterized phiE125 gp8 family phage protein